jgi:hypothetical protein
VQVLRGDAVGELVEICLADVRPAGALKEIHGGCIQVRDVVCEHRRAVRRPDARGVEEVLDGEPRALTGRQLGDEDA